MSRHFEIISEDSTRPPKEIPLPVKVGGSKECTLRIPYVDECLFIIGEYQGHLYLEPVSRDTKIFHNNQRVDSSVWIKSGDMVRVEDIIIHFTISPDLVTLNIQKAAKYLNSASPPKRQLAEQYIGQGSSPLPRVEKDNSSGTALMLKRLALPLALGVLLIVAGFLIWAKAFEVHISPEPDSLKITGPTPVIGIGKRFIALPVTYRLTALKKGYKPLEKILDLSSGQSLFSFKLEPLPGIVDFISTPESANVTLDNVFIGKTPILKKNVQSGNYTCCVALEGYKTEKRNIHVRGFGLREKFQFELIPATSYVSISSIPKGAAIEIDGKGTKSKTPSRLILSEGRHKITLSLKGYAKKLITVDVIAGKNLELPVVKLSEAPGTIKVRSVPPGASVSVDSKYRGKTPIDIKVSPRKKHQLTVSAPGHKPVSKRIKVLPGREKKLTLKLKPQFGTLFITSDPEDLRLYIDGKLQSRNAGPFNLLATTHKIEAKAKGLKTKIIKIGLMPGERKTLDLRLGQAETTKSTVNTSRASVGPKMILIRPHAFLMGSSRREQGRRSNEVQRKVVLSRPFLISAKEITNEEFRKFKPAHSSGTFSGLSLNGARQPVVNVSWDDAARYCNWLSRQRGLPPFYKEENGRMVPLTPATTGYRLPTEAEWAFVARVAGRSKPARYPWGEEYPPHAKSENYADESARGILPAIIKGYNDSFPVTGPVGSFYPNAAGLYDIGGNVSEWCNDIYSPIPAPQQTDPLGPAYGTHHVVRGASWKDASITELRLSYRGYARKGANNIGFRVARYAK